MLSLLPRPRSLVVLGLLSLLLAVPALAVERDTPVYQMIEHYVDQIVANDLNRILANESSVPPCIETDRLAMCIHPDTPPERVKEILRLLPTEAVGGDRYERQDRWAFTAITGYTGLLGNPIDLTYSFIPDGTWIPTGSGEPGSASVLFDNMNSRFATEEEWKQIFAECFADWQTYIGITYHYEPYDDGQDFPDSEGVVGIRGDVRIGAHPIDGTSGVLAYNYYPDVGDMVLDSAEYWEQPHFGYRFFHNVVTHEHGHGNGLAHVMPEDQSKLMEAIYTNNFGGIQDDDIRGGAFNYGDNAEPDNGYAEANDLGAFTGEVYIPYHSVRTTTDSDWYTFTAESAITLDVNLDPVGSTYPLGSPPVITNTKAIMDLGFELREGATGAIVIVGVNNNPVGESEELLDYDLDAGTYYLRVRRHSGADVQRYDLTINIDAGETAAPNWEPTAGLGLDIYPNPFTPKTTARFYAPGPGPVSLDVFDVQGRQVRHMETTAGGAGWMNLHWTGRDGDGNQVPQGIYFLRVKTAEQIETARAVLLR